MKLILILLPIILTGCGVAETISKQCKGSDIEMGCNTVFGYTDNEQDNDIKKKIRALESANFSNLLAISNITINIATLEANIEVIEANNANLNIDLTDLRDSIASYINQLAILANTVHTNTANIVSLQSNHNITKIIDPCGTVSNRYNEVFFRLSSGKIVSSFSDAASGLNTRFAELKPGTYSTTDGTSCIFTVNNVNGTMVVSPSVEY